jgi:glycosyltransferase involved in cell wall biosynthesis
MNNIFNQKIYLLKKFENNLCAQKYSKIRSSVYYNNEKFKSNLLNNNLIFSKSGGKRKYGFFRKNEKKFPLITIITVVLNDKRNIENTIKSVLGQKYPNLEYIIIDGSSNDGTLSIIKKYQKYLDYWTSHKDNGIFDAWNVGLKLSSGKYIGFVNSGDYLSKNAINLIHNYILRYPHREAIAGTVIKNKTYSGYFPKRIHYNFNIIPSFIGFFIKLNSIKKIGMFNTKYKYLADWDFLYKFIKTYKFSAVSTNKSEVITIFDLYGFSSTIGFFKSLFQEARIRIHNKQNIIFVIFITILRPLRKFTSCLLKKIK